MAFREGWCVHSGGWGRVTHAYIYIYYNIYIYIFIILDLILFVRMGRRETYRERGREILRLHVRRCAHALVYPSAGQAR